LRPAGEKAAQKQKKPRDELAELFGDDDDEQVGLRKP
jgi:hypothetical protein